MRPHPAFLFMLLFFFIITTLAQLTGSPKKIILIGDSITRGEGYNFRYHLWNKLLDSGYTDIDFVGTASGSYHGGFDEDFRAAGGLTAATMVSASKSDITNFKPDIAVIHAGSMDVTTMSGSSASGITAAVITFRDNINAMITNLRAANPSAKIILARFSSGSGYAPLCQRMSDTLVELAARISTTSSPVTTVDLVTGFDYEQLGDTYDKAHFNNRGAIKVADRLYPVITSWLTRTTPRIRTSPKEGPNLAQNSGVVASASRSLTNASMAIDGNLFTSWNAAAYVPGGTSPLPATDWLELDLGQTFNLKGSAIFWDINGRRFGYTIQTRTTTTSAWTISVNATNNTTYAESMRGQVNYFNAPNTRYVRLSVTNLANTGSWTLWPAQVTEFRVFDDTSAALSAFKKPHSIGRSIPATSTQGGRSQFFRLNGQSISTIKHTTTSGLYIKRTMSSVWQNQWNRNVPLLSGGTN